MKKYLNKPIISALILALVLQSGGVAAFAQGELTDGHYVESAAVEGYLGASPAYSISAEVVVTDGAIADLIDRTDRDDAVVSANQLFIDLAFQGIYEQLIGQGKPVDEIDAVSSATYTSESFLQAISVGLSKAQGGETISLDAPRLQEADGRSSSYYSLEKGARLNIVHADPEVQFYYTIDGSLPTPENPQAQRTEGKEIHLSGTGSTTHQQIELQVAAVKDGQISKPVKKTILLLAADQDNGTKKYKGSKACSYGYDVNIQVTTVNGKITAIEDRITLPTLTNAVYWNGVVEQMMGGQGTVGSMMGKTLPEATEMLTSLAGSKAEKLDAVSGATIVSDTLKYAVVDALLAEPFYSSDCRIPTPIIAAETAFFVYENIDQKINLPVRQAEETKTYYTLDDRKPGESTDLVAGSKISLDYEAEHHPAGQIIPLRAASYAGQDRSEEIKRALVFANRNPQVYYTNGVYESSYNPNRDVDAIVTVSLGMIKDIKIIPYDRISDADQARIEAELLPQIYLQQSADVQPLVGAEESSRLVLSAVERYLRLAGTSTKPEAEKPVIHVSADKLLYGNEEEIEISLSTATEGAEIYYTINYSWEDLFNGQLADPATDKEKREKYEEPFTVNIQNAEGGKVYLLATAISPATEHSPLARKDFSFAAAIPEGKIFANGIACDNFAEAVALINEAEEGGTILLGCNVEIDKETLESGMPQKPCVITSNGEYTLKGTVAPMTANSHLTLENILTDIHVIYGNGFDLTVRQGVETAFSFFGPKLYGGSKYEAQGENFAAGTPEICIQSGAYTVYASGSGGTVFEGTVTMNITDNAEVKIVGAAMGARIDGDVNVNVAGDEVEFNKFTGEESQGKIEGELTLNLIGDPAVDPYYPYTGSVNRTFGTVNLYDSTIDPQLFKQFTEVNSMTTPEEFPLQKLFIEAEDLVVLQKGKTRVFTVGIDPLHANCPDVYWSSSKADVAAVDEDGCVTAYQAGTVRLTVTSADGKFSDQITLRITP